MCARGVSLWAEHWTRLCAHGGVPTGTIPTLVQLAVCFGSQILSSEVYSYVFNYLCRRDNEGKVWDLLENSVCEGQRKLP